MATCLIAFTLLAMGDMPALAGHSRHDEAPAAVSTADSRWEGSAVREGRSWPAALTLKTSAEGAAALVDLPDLGAFARPFEGSLREGRLRLARTTPAGLLLTLEGELGAATFTGRWSGFGFEADLKLARVNKAVPRHREQQVSFRNGAVTLRGTIVLPAETGRYPGVVFTHGGGEEGRPHYISTAVMFARKGIAGLVYDKRGFGESSGQWEVASMRDLADDALAGLALLGSHPEVTSTGISGYSQGGWIAPLAASVSPDVDFLLVGGLAGVNPMEQTIYHRTNVMLEAGFDRHAVDRAAALWRQVYDSSFGRIERAAAAAAVAAARTEPWFDEAALPEIDPESRPDAGVLQFLAFEPAPVWRQVKVPVWAYWGADDTTVPVRLSRRVVAEALVEADNPDFSFHVLSRTGHDLLQRPEKGWDFPRLPAGLLEAMSDWILMLRRNPPQG